MKKITALLICCVLVCSLGLAACGEKKTEPAPEKGSSASEPVTSGSATVEPESEEDVPPVLAGGWEINQTANPSLSEEELDTFNKALEGYADSSFVPVRVLASQVVAGSNYAYLCMDKPDPDNATPGWCVIVVYKDLSGAASITSVKSIDILEPKTLETAAETNLAGGWTISEPGGRPIMLPDEEAEAAFENAAAAYTDVDLKAIALLGHQLVAGMNYRVICYGSDPAGATGTQIYIVEVYADLEGNSSVSSAQLLDLVAYVS